MPYRGDAPRLQDVAAGPIPGALISPNAVIPFIEDGKLVPLAVTGDRRMAQLPAAPSLVRDGIAQWARGAKARNIKAD